MIFPSFLLYFPFVKSESERKHFCKTALNLLNIKFPSEANFYSHTYKQKNKPKIRKFAFSLICIIFFPILKDLNDFPWYISG